MDDDAMVIYRPGPGAGPLLSPRAPI